MSLIRRILERVARGKTFRRRMPPPFGHRPIIVSPDAALRYLNPSADAFEPELLAVATEWAQPGDTVWDVGANLGVFAVAAGHRVGPSGRVLAIEADAWLASVIRRTLALPENRDLRAEVLSVAASTSPGAARFEIAARGRASNSLAGVNHRSTTGGVRETVLVPTLPLDALIEVTGPPALVKIDVEGAEEWVLSGASVLLSKHRPVVYIEVGAASRRGVAAVFHAADYVLHDPTRFPKDRTPLAECVFNTLAVPSERIGASAMPIPSEPAQAGTP